MVGALIIMCVTTGLMTVIPAYWQTVAMGSVLLIAVVMNHLLVAGKSESVEAVFTRYITIGDIVMFKMPVGLYEKALPDCHVLGGTSDRRRAGRL